MLDRSAAWQARHPLAPGQSGLSPLCRRCQNKRSSSDDYEPGHHRRKRHHRRSQLYTDSTDDSYYDRQPRRETRINHTDSRNYRRHRSSSRGSIRVVIANQNGGPRIPVRDLARSSSIDDGVRVIRREEVIDMPERRRLSRFRARTSSGDSYIEDGGRYIEDLERRTYYTPPRRVSRTRYVDEFEVPRDRSRPRSNSHVTFVDEVEEPVLVSRPRRLSRRRSMRFDGAAETENSEDEARRHSPMRFDGAADTESVEYEVRSRSPSTNRPILSRSRSGGVQLIEETVIPRSHSLQRAIKPDREARLIEKTTIEPRTPFYGCDYDARSRSQSRSTRRPGSFVEIPESDRTYSGTIRVESRPRSQDDGSYEPHLTHQGPRRRYRADSISSDSESERPHTPIPYRHVYPPSPPPRSPSPRVDYLSGMLAKAQITPPGDQGNLRDIRYARGCASRRYEDTPPPSADYRQPAFYRGEEVDGMERGPGNYECRPRGGYDGDEYSRAEEERQGGGYSWMD